MAKFVILEKAEIKGRPGMILMPSKKNPRVKRWTQTIIPPFWEMIKMSRDEINQKFGQDALDYFNEQMKENMANGVFPKRAKEAAMDKLQDFVRRRESRPQAEAPKEIYSDNYRVGWDKKREIKHGLATGIHYPVYSKNPDGSEIFFGWLKRAEIKKLLSGTYGQAEEKKESYGKRPEVIASGIDIRYREELRKYGYLSILGQTVNTPKQLADLCKIYRNDSFEVFRIFMLDDHNKCLGITAISSHRATQTEVYPETNLDYFKQRMKAVGATKYYLQHNHPNGMVEESPADQQFTKDYAKRLPGFQGSIIIDHNKFSMLGKTGDRVYISPPSGEKPSEDDPLEKRKFKVHPALGTTIANASNIFNICRDYHLKKDGYYVLLTRKNMKVTGLVEIPKEFFWDRETAEKAVFKYSLFGGGESFLWGAGRADPIMKKLMIDGVVRDVISEHGVSYYGSMDPNLIESGRPIRARVYTKEEYIQKAMLRWKDIFRI